MKEFWELIEKSKDGDKYIDSLTQYNNLRKLISKIPLDKKKKMYEYFNHLRNILTDDINYDKLHVSEGGIVNSGDDGFYLDFACWIIAQGEQFYKDFFKKGYKTIINYIEENGITEEEYRFENFIYPFQC